MSKEIVENITRSGFGLSIKRNHKLSEKIILHALLVLTVPNQNKSCKLGH